MAEVNAKDLTTKTEPASTDSMLLFGTTTNEGAKITVDNFANYTLAKLASYTYPNQVGGSSAATILAQLATLNSNTMPNTLKSRDLTSWWYTGNGKSEVASGDFSNVRPGDYIIGSSSGKKYWVVDLDYYYQHGSTSFTKHHLLMMPAFNTGSKAMNSTNITTGGYVGSEMYTTHVPAVISDFLTPDFGSNLLSFPCMLSNATSNGASSGWAWSDEKAVLPGENQIYGAQAWGKAGYDVGNHKQQLAMFREYGYNKVVGRDSIWLRDVATASWFAVALYAGNAYYYSASNPLGVRPLFVLGT